jgi:hypothetical protein
MCRSTVAYQPMNSLTQKGVFRYEGFRLEIFICGAVLIIQTYAKVLKTYNGSKQEFVF